MLERLNSRLEKETFLGQNTLELTQGMVKNFDDIESVQLRPYNKAIKEELIYPVSRQIFLNLNNNILNRWKKALGEDYNIALDSIVRLQNGESMHFGMIDLSISSQLVGSLEIAKNKFREQIVPKFGGGYFLNSGNSYHYISKELISENDWPGFLGAALLTPIIYKNEAGINVIRKRVVDNLYIGHALVRGESGLRLTTSPKKPILPNVVSYI